MLQPLEFLQCRLKTFKLFRQPQSSSKVFRLDALNNPRDGLSSTLDEKILIRTAHATTLSKSIFRFSITSLLTIFLSPIFLSRIAMEKPQTELSESGAVKMQSLRDTQTSTKNHMAFAESSMPMETWNFLVVFYMDV